MQAAMGQTSAVPLFKVTLDKSLEHAATVEEEK
jgi:hypothetical protein